MTHAPLILSIFPGIDLLGMAFEQVGFCVVRGPDPIFGGDIRTFTVPPLHFTGIIGGPPCQDFSKARRTAPTGHGVEMIANYLRIVDEAQPEWALMENVPSVPDVTTADYVTQRIDVNGGECGLHQRRNRHFQFLRRTLIPLSVGRQVTSTPTEPTATATEFNHRHTRRTWQDFCRLQGIEPLELPGMSRSAKYRAVGNAVPLPMGLLLAHAIKAWQTCVTPPRLCSCGCGRIISARAVTATIACRQRKSRRSRGLIGPTLTATRPN